MKKQTGSIVWTIDPWEFSITHRKALTNVLETCATALKAKILPFSVVSPGGLSWPIPYTRDLADEMKAAALQTTQKTILKLSLKGIAHPTVNVRPSSSRRELVENAILFAKKKKAQFIAVDTRSSTKKTFIRLGGFAEALIASSPVPVLTVNPDVKPSKKISRILFPTDFSEGSHRAFQKTLAFAKKLHAEVIVLNVEPELSQFELYNAINYGLAMSYIEEREREEILLRTKNTSDWKKEADRAKAKCTFSHITVPASISDGILKFAKEKNIDLLALATIHGPFVRAVVGSVARDILLQAKVPVLVIRETT